MAENVFELQDAYDLEFASDRRSRFGAYLAQDSRRFRSWEGALTSSAVEFAAVAFGIATVPVMSPPYVSTHPRVVYAAARWDEDGHCGLVLELAAPMAATLAARLPPQVSGWGRDCESGRFFPPEDNDQLAVYTRVTVRVPFPIGALPDPVYTDTGTADVATTKRALRALVDHANSLLAPVIATLDSDNADGNA